MEQFLKTYSNVPNGFLEDFFFITQPHYQNERFHIDFDTICKWIEIRKDSLKRLLVANFEKNYDYTVESIQLMHNNRRGSTRKELILLTSDCFKELCMLSQTKKAKEVRKYFLSVERLLSKYHHHIEDNLRSRIGLLEANQRPKYNISGGVIYILDAEKLAPGQKLYKLGKAKNIDTRLSTYNTGKAHDTEPLFILEVDDIDRVEACIKNLVKQYQYRKGREIYEISLDLLKQACTQCDELMDSFERSAEKFPAKALDGQFKQMVEADTTGDLVVQIQRY